MTHSAVLPSIQSDRVYRAAYAEGRKAGELKSPAEANPYAYGSPGYVAWADGHYDAWSARSRGVY